jgi:selenocysteine-specific elongation factor
MNKIQTHLIDFHKKNPLSVGMQKEEIRQKINSNNSILEALLGNMLNEKMINKKGEVWLDSSFTIRMNEQDVKVQSEMINLLGKQGFMSSSLEELSKKINFDKNKLMQIMIVAEKEGKILRVDGNLMFTKQNFDLLKDKVLNHFLNNDLLSVSEFKELANTSRKYAVPLLEFFDKEKITYRDGNARRLIK